MLMWLSFCWKPPEASAWDRMVSTLVIAPSGSVAAPATVMALLEPEASDLGDPYLALGPHVVLDQPAHRVLGVAQAGLGYPHPPWLALLGEPVPAGQAWPTLCA